MQNNLPHRCLASILLRQLLLQLFHMYSIFPNLEGQQTTYLHHRRHKPSK